MAKGIMSLSEVKLELILIRDVVGRYNDFTRQSISAINITEMGVKLNELLALTETADLDTFTKECIKFSTKIENML